MQLLILWRHQERNFFLEMPWPNIETRATGHEAWILPLPICKLHWKGFLQVLWNIVEWVPNSFVISKFCYSGWNHASYDWHVALTHCLLAWLSLMIVHFWEHWWSSMHLQNLASSSVKFECTFQAKNSKGSKLSNTGTSNYLSSRPGISKFRNSWLG